MTNSSGWLYPCFHAFYKNLIIIFNLIKAECKVAVVVVHADIIYF